MSSTMLANVRYQSETESALAVPLPRAPLGRIGFSVTDTGVKTRLTDGGSGLPANV